MRHNPMRFLIDHSGDLAKGVGSACFSGLAVLTSLQQEVEFAFRIISLALAIIVSVLTIISIIKKWNK